MKLRIQIALFLNFAIAAVGLKYEFPGRRFVCIETKNGNTVVSLSANKKIS